MVVKSFAAAALLVATSATAGPIWKETRAKRSFGFGGGDFGFGNMGDFGNSVSNSVSFNGYGGFHSLDNFDNFYGSDNFCGLDTSSVTVVKTEQEVVCHSVSVEIIQQQLAVIREYVKKIITTQVCEVESQTILFSQFQSGLVGFGDDVRHHSGRRLGFDSSIADHITNIHDDSGDLTCNDLGFTGQDIGSNMIYPSGYNWDAETSPSSVYSAYGACQSAASYSGVPYALPSYSSDCTSDCEEAAPPPTSDCGSGCEDVSPPPPSDCTSDCEDVSPPPPSDCTSNCDSSDAPPPTVDCGVDCPSSASNSTVAPVDVSSNATATDASVPPPSASGSSSSSSSPNPSND